MVGKRLAVLSNVHRVHDARIYFREAVFAAQHGMFVSVFAIDDGFHSEQSDNYVFRAPASRFRRFWLGWRLAYFAYRQKPDLYHFHDPEMLLPMTLLRLFGRTPVIYDCHENVVDSIYYKSHIPKIARPLLARFCHVVQWTCAKLIGSVVIATEEQLDMFPSSIRHAVVRNFPPRFIQNNSPTTTDRPFDLVHCGSFSRERGSRILLETLRILVHDFGRIDCKLLLIGVSRHELDPEEEKLVLDSGLERNLAFLGSIPYHKIPQELAKAKIGLMCHQATRQYRYGVASKLFDYMAAGLAIVGGQADFDREFAPEGSVKLYVDQTSPSQYAAAILELLDDEKRCRQMGRNGRRLFEEQYTAEAQSKGLLDFYEKQLAHVSSCAA